MRELLLRLALIGVAAGASAVARGETLTIGAIYPMTGSASFLGVPEDRALRMIIDQWNAKGGLGGRQVKLVEYDTEGNSTKAVQEMRRLAESDNVDVIFGPSSSGESLAAIAIANELKTPIITHGGSELIVTPPLKYVFDSVPVDRVAMSHVLAYAQKHGMKKIAMMSAADGYGQSGARILKEIAPKFGVEVVAAEEFNRQDTDMTAQLLRVRQANPDAIVIWSALPGPTVVLRDARAVGYDVPIIVGYGGASNDLVKNAGPAAEGVLISSFRLLVPDSLAENDPSREAVEKLYHDYKARYGQAPENFAQHSNDAALILEQAVKNVSGPLTRDSLRDAIERVDVTGANGHFHFTPENHGGLDVSSRPLVMLRYEHGKWVDAE
jgi:branched-chain amino acid transport system substrate-binding protein